MTLWYLARAAGLMALVALSVATAIGAWTSGAPRRNGQKAPGGRHFLLQRLHLSAALTGLLLLVVHVVALVADAQSGISVSAAFIPMASAYRPLAVTAGVVTLYTMVFAAIVGASRGRLTVSAWAARRWRVLHGVAYLGWALAVVHGIFSGTDTVAGYVPVVYTSCVAVVLAAVSRRLRSQDDYEESTLSRSRRSSRELTTGASR